MVWSDNTGSESTARRGSAKAWDHCRIVHSLWAKAAMLRAHMVVDRVPTAENVADCPSREEYGLMRALHCIFVEPVLDEMFWKSLAWIPVSAAEALGIAPL